MFLDIKENIFFTETGPLFFLFVCSIFQKVIVLNLYYILVNIHSVQKSKDRFFVIVPCTTKSKVVSLASF